MLASNEKNLKLRKYTSKRIYKFVLSLIDKPLFNERLVFLDEH